MADRSVRVRLEAITTNFDRKISESAVQTRRFSAELEAADGRMANIVQTGLALAPALVPIGAAGIPVVAGLTAQLGFAALGTGALVLGLNGVGDALKALDTYQLDPTQAHFKKLQATLESLGPAGGDFVLFLDTIEPRLKRLRNLAEQGLLPGVEDSIRSVLKLMPELRQVVFTTSTTLGDLVRDAGHNLDDPRWKTFFAFLETRARPTLTEMGQTAGNFAEAFANVVVAFDPLERDFSQGLLHMSQSVREWSDGLKDSPGFHDLVDYVETNGPRVLDTLGALANALISIVEAGAPVGSLVLPVLTELLKVIGGIADSPAGPVIIGIAAAVGVLGRSMALLKAVGLRGENDSMIGRALGVDQIKGIPGEYRKVAAATEELRAAQEAMALAGARAATIQSALVPDAQKRAAVVEYAAAHDRVREAEDRLTAAEQRRSDAFGQTAANALKATALVAGLAVSQSGLADKTGLANTASLALMGTIAGPWGTAVGAAIGFTMDLAHANDDLENAIKRADAAAAQMDFTQWRKSLHDVIDANNQLQKQAAPEQNGLFKNPVKFTKQGFQNLADLIPGVDDPAGKGQKQKDAATRNFDAVRKSAVDLFAVLNGANPKGLKVTDDELTGFITKISPALQRAGIDINGLLQHRTGWLDAQLAVHDWVTEMDSAQGKSQAVHDALQKLNDQITPTVDAAKALSDALDALFGPKLSQSDALDKWISGLRDLRKELKDTGGGISIQGVTGKDLDKALKNRAAIRGSVDDLLGRAKADAAAGVDGEKIARELRKGRDAIVETAVAAGQSRTAVLGYLRRLGLTGANLAAILGPVPEKIDAISAAMRKLKDKTVTIKVRNVYEATHSNALGGVHHYAQGDVANAHMPELAGPGPTRIWREPETKGEAYIPLANDFRRPRAISIWEQTGQALGVQFRRYALGGGTGLPVATSPGLSDSDISRIVRGLATIRPIADHITLQPRNYDEWVAQRDKITRAAGIGGIPQ